MIETPRLVLLQFRDWQVASCRESERKKLVVVYGETITVRFAASWKFAIQRVKAMLNAAVAVVCVQERTAEMGDSKRVIQTFISLREKLVNSTSVNSFATTTQHATGLQQVISNFFYCVRSLRLVVVQKSS